MATKRQSNRHLSRRIGTSNVLFQGVVEYKAGSKIAERYPFLDPANKEDWPFDRIESWLMENLGAQGFVTHQAHTVAVSAAAVAFNAMRAMMQDSRKRGLSTKEKRELMDGSIKAAQEITRRFDAMGILNLALDLANGHVKIHDDTAADRFGRKHKPQLVSSK